MKKLIVLFLLCVGVISAQIKQEVNGGLYLADSLYQTYIDTVGTDDTTAAHTSTTISLNFMYDWLNIVAVDTGATFDDTIAVEYGTKIYVPSTNKIGDRLMVSDTIWATATFIKDSTWSAVSYLTNDDAQTPYTIWVSDYDLLRLRYANSIANGGTDTSCVWKFYGILNRKK